MGTRVTERLLALEPPDRRDWPDYRAHFESEDIDDLIGVIRDPDLVWAEMETPESWAPVHAWRSLAQLGAVRAAEPLLALLAEAGDDDWIVAEVPDVLAELGAGALPALTSFVGRTDHDMFARSGAAQAIARIALGEPVRRAESLAALLGVLQEWPHNEPLLNALIIGSLLEMRGVEAAPLMKAAYDAGRVDLRHLGDWEDVQIDLGLLRERITPREGPDWFIEPETVPLNRVPVTDNSPARGTDAARRAKAKRKAARKARRNNRRRKYTG